MLRLIIILIVIMLLIGFLPTKLHYLEVEAYKPPVEAHKPTVNDLIALYADKYDVSSVTMSKVIRCESQYNPKAVGDGGKSFGLVQIHLPSHPNITKEQALDPDFALDFLAKSLSQKKGSMWTCYRAII